MKSRQFTRITSRGCVFIFAFLGASLGLFMEIGPFVKAQDTQSQDAKAQENAQEKPQDAGLQIVEMKGTLEAVLGNRLKLKTDDGSEAIVLVANDTEFQYTGTAEAKFLVPGLFVRFTAAFDNAGTPQSTVSDLEIFRPIKKRRMSRELMQSQTPGVYPVSERDAANKADSGDAKPSKPVPPGAQLYRIVGQLRGLQADKMSVVAAGRPVIVPLAPELKISVSSGDPFFCVQGDLVELTALQNANGLIQAETINVTGAKPLGTAVETPVGRPRRGSGKLGEEKAGKDQPETTKAKPR